MNKILKVKCPQCDTIFDYYKSPQRPFCSERCKLVDLGHWFHESYRVPTKEKNEEEVHHQEYAPNEKSEDEDQYE